MITKIWLKTKQFLYFGGRGSVKMVYGGLELRVLYHVLKFTIWA
jgi:hypothetical protein